MINGEYIMVVAPSDYPYKKYRGKYCYEHILNYWLAYGEIPEGSHIHHKDENKHNNNPENLEALNRNKHIILHNTTGKTTVVLKCPACGLIFEREKNTNQKNKPYGMQGGLIQRECPIQEEENVADHKLKGERARQRRGWRKRESERGREGRRKRERTYSCTAPEDHPQHRAPALPSAQTRPQPQRTEAHAPPDWRREPPPPAPTLRTVRCGAA